MEESERLWTVGEHAFKDGLYPLSRRILERLVERYPTDRRLPEATLLLGKARLSEGALEAAAEAFRKAQGFSPQAGRPEEARFWEAETLFRMKRFGEAHDLYERVLAAAGASPLAPDALYGLAWADLELKRSEQAEADFRRLISTFPEHATVPSATFYLARTLLDLKRPDESAVVLRGFLLRYAGHRLVPEARYLLGQALLAGGDSLEGVAQLRAFVAAHPGHELAVEARRLVLDALLRLGNKAELAEEYRRLAAQSPPTAEGLYDTGTIASRLGRAQDAETAWARLRREYPEHALAARAALDLGHAAFARNAFKDAAGLARAAGKSPEEGVRAEALVLLGESELKLRRFAAALQAFQAAVEAPGQEPALLYRALAGGGLALEEQRQWVQAAQHYDEVAAKSPDRALRDWAKQRRAAIAARLKPTPKAPAAPKAPSAAKGEAPAARP